jgi:hypothetical protein
METLCEHGANAAAVGARWNRSLGQGSSTPPNVEDLHKWMEALSLHGGMYQVLEQVCNGKHEKFVLKAATEAKAMWGCTKSARTRGAVEPWWRILQPLVDVQYQDTALLRVFQALHFISPLDSAKYMEARAAARDSFSGDLSAGRHAGGEA